MTAVADSAIYNTTPLDDDTFLGRFVARGDLAAFLLDQLRTTPADAPAEHHLIVGLRGMGKTSLLRRIAIGVTRDEALAARFAPLTFREEQYNVLTLDAFWRNCGESLAEWCERRGLAADAEQLDRCVESAEWRDADTSREAFLAACERLGRRPVLLVDNLDLILDALSEQENWALRRVLQAPGGPALYGAATHVLRQAGDRRSAFYEFFRPHTLEALSQAEVIHCMLALADSRGAAGDPVRAIVAREPERLKTLHALTGGNPRVLALIYRLLETSDGQTVFQDLEALLDQVTPLYKARVEEHQTKLPRAVIDAIALNWNPITARDLAAATATPVTTISSQIARLERDGLIEAVETSGARAGYQLTERLFNIWYLMRHGARRARNRVRWLTEFLLGYYSCRELRSLRLESEVAENVARWNPLYIEALTAALERIGIPALEIYDSDILKILIDTMARIESEWDQISESDIRAKRLSSPYNIEFDFELAIFLSKQKDRVSEALSCFDKVIYTLELGLNERPEDTPNRQFIVWGVAYSLLISIKTEFLLQINEIQAAVKLVRTMKVGPLHRLDENISRIVSFLLVNQKAFFLFDFFSLFSEAGEIYRVMMPIARDDSFAGLIRAWISLFQGDIHDAKNIRISISEGNSVRLGILDSGIYLLEDNFGAACQRLLSVLDRDPIDIGPEGWNDLLRLLTLAQNRGFGEKLIVWFESSGQAERQTPIYAAFIAFVRGEGDLRDFNPEVRGPAERIYNRLVLPRRATASEETPTALRSRRRRSR
jgi:hypothetical protein